MSRAPFLQLDRLTRSFQPGEAAVLELSLAVEEEEIVTLLGPSGCGKTTTLRMVAGFETPDSGRVLLQERDLTKVPPQRRGFGMVFQHYALFPHLSVGENVAFGLQGSDLSRSEIEEQVARSLALVRLPGTEARSVSSLSGGQQQRIALARALAPEPKVLLLDEPLSNLDAALREQTRTELRELVKKIGITAIYVTHDQEEAFALSDRIAVMESGRLDQVGPAEELYRRPATEFVARFIGRTGALNVTISALAEDTAVCRISDGVQWSALAPLSGELASGSQARLLVRPEAVRFSNPDGALAGEIVERRFAGSVYVYRVAAGGGELEVQVGDAAAAVGDRVGLEPVDPPRGLFVFPLAEGGAAA